LPRASQPYGLAFVPNGSNAFVALQALGRVVKLDASSRASIASLDLPSDPNGIRPQIRGVALSGDGSKLFVTRFLSPATSGQVFEINPTTMTLTRTIAFANDLGPDSPTSGRGVPNYLNALAISPDGVRAWLPSKKDNLSRGVFRDGNQLNHDMTVRCITSVFDPTTGTELQNERVDYDNQDRAHAVCFSPLGDLAFVSMPGNNLLKVVDTYSGESLSELLTENAPTGVAFDYASRRLYALNFLSRSVSVFDVNDLVSGVNNVAAPVGAPVSLVAVESLAANVLRGKELFYDATSTRLNEEAYMSCASCHLDGTHDGRVWDFTGFGEGLRNTIDLRGRAGTSHGRLHWSANFDEVQDFEGQIRTFGAGTGLMENSSFASGNRAHPLGLAKHGLSADLDALAAYVASLTQVPSSPHRNADGSLTADAVVGRTLFNQLNCYACHGGEQFTDSPLGAMHDVGTLKPSSGQRLNGPLAALDTPTLLGVWATAPYLHDGSAPALLDVLTTANPTNAHGSTSGLTPTQLDQLVAYLNQIDDVEPAALPANGLSLLSFTNYLATYSLSVGANAAHENPDGDSFDNLMEFALGSSNPTNGGSHFSITVEPTTGGNGILQFSHLRLAGGHWLNGSYRMGELEYQTHASPDLLNWNLSLVQITNPLNLAPPPAGYEWATFKTELPPQLIQAFGRVKVGLK
jgi:DNA-binding beta-propeller fold protein YncE